MTAFASLVSTFWILGLAVLGASSLTYHHAIWDCKRYLKHHHPDTWNKQIGNFQLRRPFLSSYRLRVFVHENKHLSLSDPVLDRKVKIIWATYFGIGAGAGMLGLGGLGLVLS